MSWKTKCQIEGLTERDCIDHHHRRHNGHHLKEDEGMVILALVGQSQSRGWTVVKADQLKTDQEDLR